jgi:hypothetical protein
VVLRLLPGDALSVDEDKAPISEYEEVSNELGVYYRYQQRPGNKQSQLLQEGRGILLQTYPNTRMRGDGQVVVVPFASYGVEVVPAFQLTSGEFWICDTNEGGRYKTVDPSAEITYVSTSNQATNGNTKALPEFP